MGIETIRVKKPEASMETPQGVLCIRELFAGASFGGIISRCAKIVGQDFPQSGLCGLNRLLRLNEKDFSLAFLGVNFPRKEKLFYGRFEMNAKQKLKKNLFQLREAKRELKARIGQSMSDRGPSGTTGKCKKLQRELAKVAKAEKGKNKKLKRMW